MKKMSDVAVKQCVAELRAACRLPIDQAALDTVVGWLRPNFERILDHPDGLKRWGDHGQRMRDNARHLGGFADFFGSHAESNTIGIEELKRAFQIVPAVDRWLLTTDAASRLWLDVPIVCALTATPILCSYAVILDRPFARQAERRRTWRRTVTRRALTFMAVAPFVVLLVAVYDLRDASVAEIVAGPRAPRLLLCASVGLTLVWVRRRLLTPKDVDHEQLARALERVRAARGSRETIVALGRALRDGIGAETVRVLVRDRGGVFEDPFRESPPLAPDTALVALLRQASAPLDLSVDGTIRPLLPVADQEWIAAGDVELAAPLRRHDGRLAALLTFGRKRAGDAYDRGDRWTVMSATAAAAVGDTGAFDEDLPEARRIGRAWAFGDVALECRTCGRIVESGPLGCGCRSDPCLAALPRHLGGKFVVQRRIGAGGMGVVYLARDTLLDRDVVLKTLPGLGPGGAERLKEEARAMAALNHECLATIYGVEIWRRTPVLVVEYFADGTLDDRLEAGPLRIEDAVRLGISLAGALSYMHAEGVLHRDLKPSNIALTAGGAPRLLDFGLALLTDSSAGSERRVAGTRAYLPPEAFHGAPPSPAFDLWALSCVLREAVGGGESAPAFAAFLARALAHTPGLRYQGGAELAAALETVLAALDVSPPVD